MKQLQQPVSFTQLPSVVTRVAPPAPRNNFDVAGFALLGAAVIAFVIGGAVATNGGRS